MPIATSNEQESKIVVQELKDKISIEVPFETAIWKFFKKLINAEKEALGVKKKQINFNLYNDELTEILMAQYGRAQKKALGFFLKDPLVKGTLTEQEILMIKNSTVRQTNEYMKKRASVISKEIMETTKQNLQQSYATVDKVIMDNGLKVTEQERLSMVMDKFSTRLENRKQTIAITETQNIFETVKNVEAVSTAERLTRQGKNLQKRWNSKLDSHTRPAHAAAHGQRVPITGLYTVAGESLDYPGDTSHGASIGNTIRCRCSSMYVLIQS